MPEEPQSSIIGPKQSQPRQVDLVREMIDHAYGDFSRGLDTPEMQADARGIMAAPSSDRSIVAGADPGATTPPGIKPSSVLRDQLRNELRQMERSIIGKSKAVAPPADMFDGGVRPEPSPPPQGPPLKDGTGFAKSPLTPGAPLDIDPQRQKSPYPSEENSRFTTKDQERDATRFVTENAPKLNRALTAWSKHKQEQFAKGGRSVDGQQIERITRLADRIRSRESTAEDNSFEEVPFASGLTQRQIANILSALGVPA
jgi:hypothetical protein